MASPGIGNLHFMGRCAIFMLNSLPASVLMGFLFGFCAGLGLGGGSLLMMWLTLAVALEHQTARAINLMFFIVAAGSVCLFRLKNRSLSFKPIIPAILTGCVAAAFFSWVSKEIDTEMLKKVFGVLLLITGIRELLYRPRNAK